MHRGNVYVRETNNFYYEGKPKKFTFRKETKKMENNEVMMNEEVNETAEMTEAKQSNNGLKTLAIIGGTALVGRFVYKKVIKPKMVKWVAGLMKEAQAQIDAEPIKAKFEEADSTETEE